MPLDTNIALGVRPVETPNMLAQMGQMMQIRQAQQGFDDKNALRDIAARHGGNISSPAFLEELGSFDPKYAAELKTTALANAKTTSEIAEKTFLGSLNALHEVKTPEDLLKFKLSRLSDPYMGPILKARGVTPEMVTAGVQSEISSLGFDASLKKTSMSLTDFYKDQTSRRGQDLNYSASSASTNASIRGQDATQSRWQYDIDNPKMTPLAGEEVLPDGSKVPAYFGFDPRTNSMTRVDVPSVTVGAPTTLANPTNALAPPAVNALTMPPAGAPTSPVARSSSAAMPSAAAPSAAMPSAAAPSSVAPGRVQFGPKSNAETLTEAQGKATGFSLRAKQASDVLDLVGKDGKVQPGLIKRGAEAVPLVGEGLGTSLNFTQSPQQQQVEQAQRAFVNAILRQESGAAINESEFNNAKKQYFPQPGDSKEVITQKRLNRETAVQSLTVAAGPGMKQAAKENGTSEVKVGAVEEGYRFKGGDPANKNNWVKQ